MLNCTSAISGTTTRLAVLQKALLVVGNGFIIITRLDVQQCSVLEDVVLVEDDVSPNLDDVLDEPPGEAVSPDEERHELVLVGFVMDRAVGSVPQAKRADVVRRGLGPEGGDAGGDEERSASSIQQDLGGSIGEEGLVSSTTSEEGEEIADGNLEVDGGDDLIVVEARKSHRAEPRVGVLMSVEFHPEEKEG